MANGYYTHTSYPATNSSGSSSAMRAELDAIMAGFTLLPTPLGIGQQGFSGGQWNTPTLIGGSHTGATFTNSTLDNTPVGSTTPNTGKFTTLTTTAAATLASLVTAAATLTGGSINAMPVGATTASSGSFTTLAASSGATVTGNVVQTGGSFSLNRASGEGDILLGQNDGYFYGNATAAGWQSPTVGNWAYNFSVQNLTVNNNQVWHKGNLPNPGSSTSGSFAGSTITSSTITGSSFATGTIDSSPIGNTTPSTGKFTTLNTSGVATLQSLATSSVAITGGTIDGTTIGLTTAAAAKYTTLGATGAVTFSGGGTLTGTFTGGTFSGVNLTGDTINNTTIGATTPSTGSFTTLAASGAISFSGLVTATSGVTLSSGGTYSPLLTLTAGSYSPFIRSNSSASTIEMVNGANTAINFSLGDGGVLNLPRARPTWVGLTPWDNGNLTNLSQLANGPGYLTSSGTIFSAQYLRQGASTSGAAMAFNWAGQGGQPTWLWGGNDGANMYVWNPANFNVNYANSAGSAGSVGGVTSPATNGSTCPWNTGIVELGSMEGGNTINAASPQVVVGGRCTTSTDINRVYFHVVQLRNQ
ncbi:hypothetical protein [Paraburkholderia youngii]|uniref:hypothetical protein n=1 Tax=Paraburkholderia youngii TaxID=2782701 RepID=UPI001590F8FB|nr:hypothetical protein [Paraburkholderia youngii]NUX58652.1 hypothetical protein [Paraburkholderia youngii]